MSLDRIDLNRVATFVQIAEASGVSAAASRAKLPKSSVSRALSQLEDELGVELVVRRAKQFQLTEAGRAFYEAAARGIAAVSEAREGLRRDRGVPQGSLRVAAPPVFAAFIVTPVIVAFTKKYPLVDVELCVTAAKLDPVRDGFDVILTSGPLDDSSARVRKLGALHGGVFASKEYLAERGIPRRVAELAKHDCILQSRAEAKTRWTLTGPAGSSDVKVRGRVTVDDQFTAIAAANAGAGLVVLPLHHQMHDPMAKGLVRVLPDYVLPAEPTHLVYAASRHVPLRVTMFCDALLARVQSTCVGPS